MEPDSVILYCPDRHLTYGGATAERVGVGGGVTARLRLARALAGQGCRVTVVANVPRREVHHKVSFVPLAEARRLEAGVLILNSTGGDLDLSPVLELDLRVRLRMAWIGGEARVKGLEAVGYDFLVAPSNYVRRGVGGWGVPPARCVVIHNGVPERRRSWWPVRRDPFRMVYTGHPMKGLDSAVELLRLLRREDPRFTLHVYGGRRLWGQEDETANLPEGVVWHGLVGQDALADALRQAGFSINLQGLADGFGIAMAEAMGAGCLVVASAIGAYPELIRQGYDGFLVAGPHGAPETLRRTARLIRDLTAAPGLAATVRRNAGASPLPWSVVARAWMGQWRRALAPEPEGAWEPPWSCPECGGGLYPLADGYHCGACGWFARELGG
ncbi:MAG TPA: glycosyltransferase family 4 protein [Thermoanaerobaculia bacterium]|jgi:glycosyltransferase involved in cell wall biosynthesis|nr:glycosyltransferase family 4 protein [Thermoanaerobaculia bacterium]